MTSSFGVENLGRRRRPRLSRASPEVSSMPRVLLPPSSVQTRACRVKVSCSVCLVRPPRPEHTPSLRCKAASLFLLFQVSRLFVGNMDVCASESCFSRKVMSEVSVSRRRRSPSARSALAAYVYFHPSIRPCHRLGREGSKDRFGRRASECKDLFDPRSHFIRMRVTYRRR
jgi:hypothetical protein